MSSDLVRPVWKQSAAGQHSHALGWTLDKDVPSPLRGLAYGRSPAKDLMSWSPIYVVCRGDGGQGLPTVGPSENLAIDRG